jgi:steroid delta-isomerase-like uncharacterized protein
MIHVSRLSFTLAHQQQLTLRGARVANNAAIARRWFEEVWVAGGEAVVDQLMAPEAVALMEGRTVNGPVEFKDVRRMLMQVFPDLRMTVDDAIEQDGKVAVRWSATATHRGEGLGVPATNRRVSFRGMTWLEVRENRIVRGWDSWNLGALLAELQGSGPRKPD